MIDETSYQYFKSVFSKERKKYIKKLDDSFQLSIGLNSVFYLLNFLLPFIVWGHIYLFYIQTEKSMFSWTVVVLAALFFISLFIVCIFKIRSNGIIRKDIITNKNSLELSRNLRLRQLYIVLIFSFFILTSCFVILTKLNNFSFFIIITFFPILITNGSIILCSQESQIITGIKISHSINQYLDFFNGNENMNSKFLNEVNETLNISQFNNFIEKEYKKNIGFWGESEDKLSVCYMNKDFDLMLCLMVDEN